MSTSAEPLSPGAASNALTPIPWEEMLSSVGGDEPTLAEIVAAYLDEICEEKSRMPGGESDAGLKQCAKSSHKIKSAVRFFRQGELAKFVERLEHAAEAGDEQLTQQLSPGVVEAIESLLAEIRRGPCAIG